MVRADRSQRKREMFSDQRTIQALPDCDLFDRVTAPVSFAVGVAVALLQFRICRFPDLAHRLAGVDHQGHASQGEKS